MSCHPLRGVPTRPRTRPDELTKAAWHEAGHALVCTMYFGNVESVSIIPEGDSLGRQVARNTWGFSADRVKELREAGRDDWAESIARQGIQWSLAGRAAESVLTGHASYWDLSGDHTKAIEYAEAIAPPFANVRQRRAWVSAFLYRERDHVRCWLKAYRPHLQSLSEALLKRRVIDGAELWDVLAELPPLQFPKREALLMRRLVTQEKAREGVRS